jgi:hypothetical protein
LPKELLSIFVLSAEIDVVSQRHSLVKEGSSH